MFLLKKYKEKGLVVVATRTLGLLYDMSLFHVVGDYMSDVMLSLEFGESTVLENTIVQLDGLLSIKVKHPK